jgi:hypothetical protein
MFKTFNSLGQHQNIGATEIRASASKAESIGRRVLRQAPFEGLRVCDRVYDTEHRAKSKKSEIGGQ